MIENKDYLSIRVLFLEKLILNFINKKIIKYELKLYEWCYREGSDNVWNQWKKVWNNMKIWRKGKYYIWLKNEILDLNYDINTGEYLNLENFTLHHEPYIWEHLLTKGVHPVHKDNHSKGRMFNKNEGDLFIDE